MNATVDVMDNDIFNFSAYDKNFDSKAASDLFKKM